VRERTNQVYLCRKHRRQYLVDGRPLMVAPVGATVTIAPHDLSDGWPAPDDGDFVVSWSEQNGWGTAYLIIGAHQVKSTVHPRRWSLRCRKVGPALAAGIREEDRMFTIVWHRRHRRRPQ
jgi:hypothetical protein